MNKLETNRDKEHEDIKYMKLALKEAKKAFEKKEIPVGAVIVKNGEIIASAHNKKEEKNDATAHSEILAIQKASAITKNWRFNDATMYVTLEPCFMCMGAIMEARIGRLVYATKDEKRGAAKSVIKMTEVNKYHKIVIKSGVCKEESEKLIKTFFEKLRKKGK